MTGVRDNDGPEGAKPEQEVAAHALANEPVEVTLPPDNKAAGRKHEAQRCQARQLLSSSQELLRQSTWAKTSEKNCRVPITI